MKNLFKLLLLSFLVILITKNTSLSQIKIDGLFFDWKPEMQLDVPPNQVEKTFNQGDPDAPDPNNPSYFVDLDIEDVYATDDADFVYFRVKLNPAANVLNIPNDTSYHGGAAIAVYISVDPGASDTTGLTWGWWGSGYDFFVQVFPEDSIARATTIYDQFIWEHMQQGNGWDFVQWDTLIGAKVAWNADNNDVEFAVPKYALFNPHNLPNFVIPDSIAIMVYAGENLGPWRADYASNPGVSGYPVKMKNPGLVKVDGLFFDWNNNWQLDVSPNQPELTFGNGDPDAPDPNNPSFFADLDIEDVYATNDDDYVYVRVKMNPAANVLNTLTDTTYHGGAAIGIYISVDPGTSDTTGLTWGWWGSGYDFMIQVFPEDTLMKLNTGFPQAVWEHTQMSNGWDFELADQYRGAWVSWNVDYNDVEVAIPKILLLNPKNLPNFQTPDSIAIMIYAGENFGPWRADYASNPGVAGYPLKLVTTGIHDRNDFVPSSFTLYQNYPNPFNPSTTISFDLPSNGFVSLKIYDLLGREITTLINQELSSGKHRINFDGKTLTSGVYLYTLQFNGNIQSRKMILIK